MTSTPADGQAVGRGQAGETAADDDALDCLHGSLLPALELSQSLNGLCVSPHWSRAMMPRMIIRPPSAPTS